MPGFGAPAQRPTFCGRLLRLGHGPAAQGQVCPLLSANQGNCLANAFTRAGDHNNLVGQVKTYFIRHGLPPNVPILLTDRLRVVFKGGFEIIPYCVFRIHDLAEKRGFHREGAKRAKFFLGKA
jgi:hypothetical protein